MRKKIILASGSPRRKELLTLAGIKFQVQTPDLDETPLPRENAKKMVKRLAELKAFEVCRFLNDEKVCFVISADTTVVDPKGVILGKPTSALQAAKMMNKLQGDQHSVFTGYCILSLKRGKIFSSISRVVETKVTLQKLSPKEIKEYISKGESFDKAGAYAAQGFGMALIERIVGSYTNVVGLPVTEVVRDLKVLGWTA